MKPGRFKELVHGFGVGPRPISAGTRALAGKYLSKPKLTMLLLVGCWHLMAMELGDRRWCYFIRAENGATKIGVAWNVRSRLSALQSACPERLLLICRVPGGELAEAYFHEVLKDECVRGEWFRGPNTARVTAEVLAVAPLVEAA